MMALLTLLPIFGYATLFYIYLKRSISVSIFFSISSIITFLFLFGMIDILRVSTYILFYAGMALLVIMGVIYTDKLKEAVKSVPFVMFTSMSIIYLYLMQDAQLFFWDEFSHWGSFIKEMYFFHQFYDSTSVAAHLNYPPGISIWDYFLVMPTGYREGTLYFAYFLILFSSTLMMYEKLSFKQIHWIVLIFFIQIVIFAGFGHWFSCIYVDHIIAVMFAGLILSFLVESFKAKELLLFIFPLISIVLVKEIGLYFGLASLGFFLIVFIIKSQLSLKKSFISHLKEQSQVIGILVILALSMVLVLKAWGIRQESVGIQKEQQSISGIANSLFYDKKVLSDKNEAEVKKRFWEVVTSQQLHKEKVSLNYNEFSYSIMSKYTKNIKLTTVGVFLFFIFLCVVAYLTTYRRDKQIKIVVLGSYALIITIIYLFILYFSFLVAFGNGALRIPSFVRYMNIAVLPLLFIGFTFFLPIFQQNSNLKKKDKNQNIKLFISVLGLITILTFIVKPYFKPLYSQLENRFKVNSDNMAESILKYIPKKAKLFVVFPIKNNGSLNNILKYSLIPARSSISNYTFGKKTSQEMINIYKDYDYIWFASLNQEIVNKNKFFLKQKNSKNIYVLYKVEVTNGKINFQPIE